MKSKRNYMRLGIIERFTTTLGLLCLSLVVTKTYAALFLVLFLLIVLKLQGVRWYSLFRFLRIPVSFVLLGLVSIMLVLGTEAPDAVFLISKRYIPLSITESSLHDAEVVLWRALNALLSLYFFIGTTTVKEKSALAGKLRIPNSLVELGILSFRYIQLLEQKGKEIRCAQRLRLGYISYRSSFQSTVMLLSTVFLQSMVAFQTNHQALLTRGYTGTLYYRNASHLPKDRKWFIILTIACVVLLLFCYKIFCL